MNKEESKEWISADVDAIVRSINAKIEVKGLVQYISTVVHTSNDEVVINIVKSVQERSFNMEKNMLLSLSDELNNPEKTFYILNHELEKFLREYDKKVVDALPNKNILKETSLIIYSGNSIITNLIKKDKKVNLDEIFASSFPEEEDSYFINKEDVVNYIRGQILNYGYHLKIEYIDKKYYEGYISEYVDTTIIVSLVNQAKE